MALSRVNLDLYSKFKSYNIIVIVLTKDQTHESSDTG
jgi:hypothetical protein